MLSEQLLCPSHHVDMGYLPVNELDIASAHCGVKSHSIPTLPMFGHRVGSLTKVGKGLSEQNWGRHPPPTSQKFPEAVTCVCTACEGEKEPESQPLLASRPMCDSKTLGLGLKTSQSQSTEKTSRHLYAQNLVTRRAPFRSCKS